MLVTIFLLCSVVSVAEGNRPQVALEADQTFVRKQVSSKVELTCCYSTKYTGTIHHSWVITTVTNKETHDIRRVKIDNRMTENKKAGKTGSIQCHILVLRELAVSDAGLYQCFLNATADEGIWSHGTFLQVYRPMYKFLNLSETTKNNILIVQGFLLLLCVMLPGTKLLYKSKEIYTMEKKKAIREEENIYEGLRIEDFSSPYDQIHRAPAEVTYQDVYSEAEPHLEKP